MKVMFTAVIALSLGCQITSAGPTVTRVEGIDLTPGRLTLLPVQSANISLRVTMSRGDSNGAAAAVEWTTTGGSVTSSFYQGGTRYLTYLAPQPPGDYFLIVTSVTGYPADTAKITVTNTVLPVWGVSVAPSSANLAINDTVTFRATTTEEGGSVIVGRPIVWTSSDPAIATVIQSTGFVRGVAAGTVTITATSEDRSATATVTVHQ